MTDPNYQREIAAYTMGSRSTMSETGFSRVPLSTFMSIVMSIETYGSKQTKNRIIKDSDP